MLVPILDNPFGQCGTNPRKLIQLGSPGGVNIDQIGACPRNIISRICWISSISRISCIGCISSIWAICPGAALIRGILSFRKLGGGFVRNIYFLTVFELLRQIHQIDISLRQKLDMIQSIINPGIDRQMNKSGFFNGTGNINHNFPI